MQEHHPLLIKALQLVGVEIPGGTVAGKRRFGFKKSKKLLFSLLGFVILVSLGIVLSIRFGISPDQKVYKATESVTMRVGATNIEKAKVVLLGPNQKEVTAQVNKSVVEGKSVVTIEPPRSFQPGQYTLEVTEKNGSKHTQNFMWGVLALNPNKSIYSSNQEAYMAYAVLDEEGKMVCDAEIKLKIENVKLKISDELSTDNGKIKVNPECSKKALVDKDDFESRYKLAGVGTYSLHLTAKTKNGTYSTDDQIQVKENIPFSVERTSRTRIYPVHNYDMLITIKANQDFSGTISEVVPEEFILSQFTTTSVPFMENINPQEPKTKLLSWTVNLKKGEKIYIGYKYDAPDKSPWFFTTGPLFFKSDNKEVFKENRLWQIAVDDLAPNGYWKFDEGVDNTCQGGTNDACNSGSDTTTLDGALTGALWNTMGKRNKSLTFDATDDRVVVKSSANLAGQTAGSLSTWIYPTTMDATQRGIYSEDIAGGTVLHLITVNSTFVFSIRSSGAVWTDCATTTTYTTNKWYHITSTFNSSNGDINVYVNGKLACTSTTWDGTFTASVTSSLIGDYTNAGTFGFGGKIDEVKTYTSELTASQVLVDYNQGSSAVLGQADQSILDNGLVGYWKMDESSGNAADSSGNGSTLTDTNTVAYVSGKFANGGDFESGNSEYEYAADNATLSLTGNLSLATWIKPESTTASTQYDIAGKWDATNKSYLLAQYGDEIRLYLNSASNYVETTSANLATGTWYQIVASYTASTQQVKIYINGQESATTTTGTIPTSITDNASSFNVGAEASTSESTLNLQVGASASDGEEHGMATSDNRTWTTSGTAAITSTILSPGRHAVANGDTYSAGARFTSVTVPQGATITSATFTLTPQATYNAGANVIKYHVSGEDADNSGVFTTSAGMLNATNRPRTTAECGPWTQTSITVDVEQSVTVTSCVQEIIDRVGWTSGNAMSIILDTHTDTSDSEWQDYNAYDGSTIKAPQLDITYTASSASNYYDGIIDEVRVYNRAVSSGEVQQLYNFAPGPVGYWNFEEGTGTSANDKSGNGTTGTWAADNSGHWIQGKYGKGGQFNGNDDVVTTSDNTILEPKALTVEAWVKFNQLTGVTAIGGSSSDYQYIIFKKNSRGGNFEGYQISKDANHHLTLQVTDANNLESSSAVSTTTVTTGKWYHVAGTFNKDDTAKTLKIYVNGVLENSSTHAYDLDYGTTGLNFGSTQQFWDSFFSGTLDDVKIYNYERTASQITEDMNANHPLGGSPNASQVAYYKFDEGADNTCAGGTNDICNSGSQASTIDGVTSNTSRINTGKIKKALDFNGTTSYAQVVNSNAIDFDIGLVSAFTFSGWIYADNAGEGSGGRMFSKGTNTWLRVDTLSGSNLDIEASADLTTTDATVNISTPITTGTWNHVALVYTDDADDEIDIYVNGKLRGSSTDGSGTPAITDTADLIIGNDTTSATQTFDGRIDEFKVYNVALSANDIKIDYNQGKSLVLGAVGTESDGITSSFSSDRGYCPPGDTTATCAPIGFWDFEEGTGQTAYDRSSSGDNAILGASASTGTDDPVWSIGKTGNGLTFDGSNDYAGSTGTSVDGLSQASLMFWMKTTTSSLDKYIVSIPFTSAGGNGFDVRTNTTSLNTFVKTSVGTVDLSDSTSFNDGKWHQVAVIYNGANVYIYRDGILKNSSALTGTIDVQADNEFNFGRFGSFGGFYTGSLDDIRVYNYARSAAQIAWDYNYGKPVAWWKMDECTGSSINDSIGIQAIGTLTIGATGTQTATGTCSTSGAWFNGVSGKRNYSVNFDGTDDYVSVADSSSLQLATALTVAAWFKTSTSVSGQGKGVVRKDTTTGTRYLYGLDFGNSANCSGATNKITAEYYNGTVYCKASTNTLNDGLWHHAAMTISGTTMTLYIDGASQGTTTLAGTQGVPTGEMDIAANPPSTGGGRGDYFTGQIDDVRVYNYPLTAQQIKTVMNNGAIRWGPVTGAP